jgi:hypothetical protein
MVVPAVETNHTDKALGVVLASPLFEGSEAFCFSRAAAMGPSWSRRDIMAKGQKRSNREIRKPKKKKEPATAPVILSRGLSDSIKNPKKKK